MEDVNAGRAWYLFSRDHNVIEIQCRPEFLDQKVTFCTQFYQLHVCVQRSVYRIFAPPTARYNMYVTHSFFCSESLGTSTHS